MGCIFWWVSDVVFGVILIFEIYPLVNKHRNGATKRSSTVRHTAVSFQETTEQKNHIAIWILLTQICVFFSTKHFSKVGHVI